MAAFMDESGVDARIVHSHIRGSLHSHFKTVPFNHVYILHHQFFGHIIPNSPTEQHSFAKDCNIYLDVTVTYNFISKGGNGPMH
jgi:hypothetical protein